MQTLWVNYFLVYTLGTNNFSYTLWFLLYFIFIFLLTRDRGVVYSCGSKLGAETVLRFLRKAPSFSRKCYYKLYYYKWCVSPQDSSVSLYKVTACSFSIQWRAPLGEQMVTTCSKIWKINRTVKGNLKLTSMTLIKVIWKNSNWLWAELLPQELEGPRKLLWVLQLNV